MDISRLPTVGRKGQNRQQFPVRETFPDRATNLLPDREIVTRYGNTCEQMPCAHVMEQSAHKFDLKIVNFDPFYI